MVLYDLGQNDGHKARLQFTAGSAGLGLTGRVRVELGLDAGNVGAGLDDDVDHVEHGDFEVAEGGLVFDVGVGQDEAHDEAGVLVFDDGGGQWAVEGDVVVEGVEAKGLQVGGHERADAVEEALLPLWLGAGWNKLAFIALVEDVLHFEKPP